MDKQFKLYGIIDISTGKLVNNITNPGHKYWEKRKCAEKAIDNYSPKWNHNVNKNNLKIVEIKCEIQ